MTSTGITIDYDVPVPVSGGTALTTDVYRPATVGRYPVILVRTPYGKLAAPTGLGVFGFDTLGAVRAGYVVVIQDVRGTGASPGRFRRYVYEADDGADAIAWTAGQEWSNGCVGMVGASYLGAAALYAAMRMPPALKATVPSIAPCAHYEGAAYQGGAFQLGRALTVESAMAQASLLREEGLGADVSAGRDFIESIVADRWEAFAHLPLAELARSTPWLSDYGGWLWHPDRGDFGRETAINEHFGSIDVPALHIAGWYDVHLKGSLQAYTGLRDGAASGYARANQRLIITPWGHAPPSDVVGDVWLGSAAMTVDLQALHLEFLDAHLKGETLVERAPVRIFVMGANQWRDEDQWPLARAVETRFYLRSDGRLTREQSAEEAPDTFLYDPRDPVLTVGGNTLLPGTFFIGPRDRRSVEQRPDVLTYTTDVLEEDIEVTGPVTAHLSVTTSARDTDFTVALVDVYPDGRAIGIADGILRLRYRNGFEAQHLAEPGQVYAITVDLIATSNVFRAGHRVRVEISSSNFPRFDRNPNHGGVIAEATERDFVVAIQHIFHDANRISFIALPVIPP